METTTPCFLFKIKGLFYNRLQDLFIRKTALVIRNFCCANWQKLTEIQLCLAFLWTDSFLFNYSTFSMTAAAFTIESKITREAIYFFCTPKILKSYIIPGWNCLWNYTCLHIFLAYVIITFLHSIMALFINSQVTVWHCKAAYK